MEEKNRTMLLVSFQGSKHANVYLLFTKLGGNWDYFQLGVGPNFGPKKVLISLQTVEMATTCRFPWLHHKSRSFLLSACIFYMNIQYMSEDVTFPVWKNINTDRRNNTCQGYPTNSQSYSRMCTVLTRMEFSIRQKRRYPSFCIVSFFST